MTEPASPPSALKKPEGAYRVLHSADWHLGKTLRDLSREEEHEHFLEFLMSELIALKVDLLIIAGDIFDSANPPQSAQAQYYRFLSKLYSETDCQTLIIGGNHDSPAQLEAPSQVLSALRTTVVGTAIDPPAESVKYFPSKESPELGVAAIPFLRDRDLRQGKAGQGAAEIRKAIVEGIQRHYQEAAEGAESAVPLLATGHLTVTGATTSDSERDIHIGGLGSVTTELFPAAFDYVALGHLHRPQICGDCDHIRYSGSPIPLSFSEATDYKSVNILDFAEGKLIAQQLRPIPLSRQLIQLKCSRAELEQSLDEFECELREFTPWIELIITDPIAGEDLMGRARAAAEGKAFEIVQVIAARSRSASIEKVAASDLESSELLLDPKRVFELRLEGEENLEPKEREALVHAFAEVLESYEQGEESTAP